MSKRVNIGKDLELNYEDYGQGDTVVFIPGLTCTSKFFENNLQALAANNRVISYDPRSQGQSTVTEKGNNFIQRADDLNAFITSLDIDKAVIAGWSMGAYDAYAYFARFGLDKVKAFVNIDMPPKTIQVNKDDWSQGPLEVVREMYRSILATDQPYFFESYIHHMIIRNVEAEDVTWMLEQSRHTPPIIAAQIVADANLCDYSDVARKIAKEIPVMHFVRQDWSTMAVNWLDKNTPDIECKVMGGHMMFWEEADAFNTALAGFFKGL